MDFIPLLKMVSRKAWESSDKLCLFIFVGKKRLQAFSGLPEGLSDTETLLQPLGQSKDPEEVGVAWGSILGVVFYSRIETVMSHGVLGHKEIPSVAHAPLTALISGAIPSVLPSPSLYFSAGHGPSCSPLRCPGQMLAAAQGSLFFRGPVLMDL